MCRFGELLRQHLKEADGSPCSLRPTLKLVEAIALSFPYLPYPADPPTLKLGLCAPPERGSTTRRRSTVPVLIGSGRLGWPRGYRVSQSRVARRTRAIGLGDLVRYWVS
jgi:hypothetical protein